VNERFNHFSHRASRILGSSYAFIVAIAIVVVWLATGPIFGFSDTWQLIINTGTTIVTFLMVFVIQNSQNRDAIALQIKIDELIRATEGARNTLIDLDKLTDPQLEELEREFKRICERDTQTPRGRQQAQSAR
jgi:low affinity Fe/Cu permease